MDTGSVFLVGLFNIAAAAVVAYLLFRWISPGPETAESFWRARKWAAWVVAMLTIALLTRVFNRGFDIDRFAAWVLGVVVWGGLAFALGWTWTRVKEGGTRPTASNGSSWESRPQVAATTVPSYQTSVARSSPTQKSDSPEVTDENRFWADALHEFEGPNRDAGTWARAFAESGGNDAAAKAQYLKVRKEQLQVKHRQQAAAEAAHAAEVGEARRLLESAGYRVTDATDGTTAPVVTDDDLIAMARSVRQKQEAAQTESRPKVYEGGPSIRDRISAATVMTQDNLRLAIDLAGRAGFLVEQVQQPGGNTRFLISSRGGAEVSPVSQGSEAELLQWVRTVVCPRFLDSSPEEHS